MSWRRGSGVLWSTGFSVILSRETRCAVRVTEGTSLGERRVKLDDNLNCKECCYFRIKGSN
jgi:hypothetical protein